MWDMDNFLRSAGAQRVDERASRRLSGELEDFSKELLWQARMLARHAGRKTVIREDIVLAKKMLE